METDAALPIFAALALVAVVMLAARRRRAAPAPPPLSATSDDRTFVGIALGPRESDATMVGPIVQARPASDATVVDVRVAAPPAAPAAPAAVPATSDVPTASIRASEQVATAPTIRIPRLLARVTVTKGGSGTHALEAREHTIGRSTRADIVLADPSVSGQHAKLSPSGDAFVVSDLGSMNGTTVDGQPVQGERLLRGGETLGIGDARLRYERLA